MAQTLKYVIGKDYRPLTVLEAKGGNTFSPDYDKNNWVQARQYEDSLRQVFVEITNEDGSTYDLTGANVLFEGILPDNEHKILDNSHVVFYEDPTTGKFRFDMPAQAFSVAGQYKQAFFRVVKDYRNIATLEFKFEVLADMVVTGMVARDYISPLEDLFNTIKEAETKNVAELKKIVDDKINEITDLMTTLNQTNSATLSELNSAKTALSALEEKIKQDGLFTQGEAKDFENQLTDWIKLNSSLTINTIKDLKTTNLKKGQKAVVLGENEIGDGGAATFLITDNPSGYSIDLDNGLKAEKINSDERNYYDEVKVNTERINHTDVYFAEIPKNDKNGQPITPYIIQNGKARVYDSATKQYGFKEAPSGEKLTPTEYARKHHTTLTVNGSSSININNVAYPEGNIIGDGKILNTLTPPEDANIPSNFGYIGFDKDRSIQEYPFNTTAQQMLDDGVINSWVYYWPLIRDSKVVDDSTFVGNEGRVKVTANDPRIGLGIKADGTLIIAACDGRSLNQKGLTSSEFAQEMLKHGCVNAWHLDGGGSTSLTYKGLKLNRNIDDNGAADRAIPFTFNVKKPGADTGIADAYSQAGAAKQDAVRQLAPGIAMLDGKTAKWFGNINFKSDDELENWLQNTTSDDDWKAKKISGIITTGYRDSAPGKAVGFSGIESWYATISWIQIAGNEYGSLKMTANFGASERTVYRSLRESHWSDWIVAGHPHEVTPSKVDPTVSVCKVLRSGMLVQVDVKMVINDLNDWTIIVKGLPHPIDEVQEIQLAGDNKAHALITTAGDVIVKGEAGIYYLHTTYFTNDPLI